MLALHEQFGIEHTTIQVRQVIELPLCFGSKPLLQLTHGGDRSLPAKIAVSVECYEQASEIKTLNFSCG